jgi:hypothetical protein
MRYHLSQLLALFKVLKEVNNSLHCHLTVIIHCKNRKKKKIIMLVLVPGF